MTLTQLRNKLLATATTQRCQYPNYCLYAIEQYYHAPGKLSTMVLEVAARALTKHALNVHCGHDDVYSALDTGWIMLMARDAQQAADHRRSI